MSSPVVSVAEYREILGDTSSTDAEILKRIEYLEAFTRNIIKFELNKYVKDADKRSVASEKAGEI